MPTAQQLENLAMAHAILDGIPEQQIMLGRYVSQRGPSLVNGTVCSGLGWLAQHPFFTKQGLHLSDEGVDAQPYLQVGKRTVTTANAVEALFGCVDDKCAFYTLHTLDAACGDGLWDTQLSAKHTVLTDKALLLARYKAFYRRATTLPKSDTYASREVLVCPHCRGLQDGVIDDYVVAASHAPHAEQCGHCDGWFTVQHSVLGHFAVTATTMPVR